MLSIFFVFLFFQIKNSNSEFYFFFFFERFYLILFSFCLFLFNSNDKLLGCFVWTWSRPKASFIMAHCSCSNALLSALFLPKLYEKRRSQNRRNADNQVANKREKKEETTEYCDEGRRRRISGSNRKMKCIPFQ